MLRFKGFSGADITSVEQKINAWMTRAEPDIKMMEQSTGPNGEITVSFVFDEGFLAGEQRLTEEAAAIVEHALKEQPVLEPLKVDQEQV